MHFSFYLAAVLAGVFIPLQAAVNGSLRKTSESPVFAALVSFAGGTLALMVLLLATPVAKPKLEQVSGTPWYGYTGGLLGAFFVIVAVLSQPKIGAASLVACMVLGQVICSMIFDHYGIFGISIRELTVTRALGGLLVVGGVILVVKP